MSSLKKNFAYNILYQILAIVLPLITAPYISRILGAEKVGIYSYTYSIASYFLLFAMLGITNHGSRSVAASNKLKENRSLCFINNYVIQLSVSIIVSLAYTGYVLIFVKENINIALIQVVMVLSSIFDVNWFFWGLEKFKLTVVRNVLCKIFTVICIFIFVKNGNDLWKYTLIMCLGIFISQLLLWKFIRKEIKIVKPDWKQVKRNLKPILVLFVPILAYSLYRIMDKIMIGQFSNMSEVGYYANAEKILNIPIGIITALGNVMLPRISYLLSTGNVVLQHRYIELSIRFVSIVEGAICFGIAGTANVFIPLYYGEEFVKSGTILTILIFTALISGWANVIRTQLLIPAKKDKIYVVSMLSAALINFISNIVLIPIYKSMGAVIGTVTAEVVVLLVQAFSVRKELDFRLYIKENFVFLISGLLMCLLLRGMSQVLILPKLALLILEVFVGGIFYIGVSIMILFVKKDELWRIGMQYYKKLRNSK